MNNATIDLQTLKMNSHDPRCHQRFLVFSNDMSHWRAHADDRSWWLQREKECVELFRHHGYDLQSGIWYCLIACHRNGWEGISSASLLLCNGYSQKHIPCWPPLAARELRAQILNSYCKLLMPFIYALPLTSANRTALAQLSHAIRLLKDHSEALGGSHQDAFQQLLQWQEAQLHSSKSENPHSKEKSLLSDVSPTPKTLVQTDSGPWRFSWLSGTIGASIAAICISGGMLYKDPAVLSFSNKIWPENRLYKSWKQALENNVSSLQPNNSYKEIHQHLISLETRLLDAETKRKPHMTISELKTSIYQIQKMLEPQKLSLEYQLTDITLQRENNREINSLELAMLSEKVNKLQDWITLLKTASAH